MPHSESRRHNLGDFKKVFFYFSAIEIAVETIKMAQCLIFTLRKHSHATYSHFSRLKNDNFQLNFLTIFILFAQNIDCGYTLEPPQ